MRQQNIIIALFVVALIGVGVFLFMGGQKSQSERTAVNNNATTSQRAENMAKPKTNNMEKQKNVVEIALDNSDFSTLVSVLTQAGLVETLSGEGPFTVFAPTNDAFKKIPESTLKEILADKNRLTSILTYHVVPGKVMAKDVMNLKFAKTVQGSQLSIEVKNGIVMVDEAKVVTPDIEARNGVIHIIDTVLVPQ